MRWDRAVHHLEALAASCADMATRPATLFPLRVQQLWVFGDVLGEPRDLDVVTVALAVDAPVDDVPWMGEPRGAQHWAQAVRLPQSPVLTLWRSVHAPVWNHRVERPVRLWDVTAGVDEAALTALREGRGEALRPAAPTDAELTDRLGDELDVCLRDLRARTRAYEEKRWAPGKLEPVADALWRSGAGYLDVLDAVRRASA
jgi:hypothetical protein